LVKGVQESSYLHFWF